MTGLSDTMFSSPEMAAVFSAPVFVQRMLDFEAALARAQAGTGMIPEAAAGAIAASCRAELFDIPALFRDGAEAGTPAIPLVRRLMKLAGTFQEPGTAEAGGFVHWGATSQDVIDTATVLQIRDGLDLLIGDLLQVASACAELAERHRRTPMVGRTLLQHAVPITFGLKAARWLGLTTRLIRRLRDLRDHALVVQLGGAAGTLAAMGDQGLRVMERVAQELHLGVPDLPWHTERDRIADIAAALGTLAGGMGKVATDVVLLSQTEIGEASSAAAATTGRSSTMPHKHNPVEATNAIACARLAIGLVPTVLGASLQEHERAAGAWQTEWQAVPQLFRLTAGAVRWVQRAVGGLEVDAGRMRANLEQTRGLIMAEALTMALAPRLGRHEAYRVVQQLSDQSATARTSLQQAAGSDPQVRAALTAEEINRAFDVAAYLGSTDAFIDRALAAYRALAHPAQETR